MIQHLSSEVSLHMGNMCLDQNVNKDDHGIGIHNTHVIKTTNEPCCLTAKKINFYKEIYAVEYYFAIESNEVLTLLWPGWILETLNQMI